LRGPPFDIKIAVVIRIARALTLSLTLCSLLPGSARADAPHYARIWLYGDLSLKLMPNWSVDLIPGMRFEPSRSSGEHKGHYMTELFVGPSFHTSSGPLSFRLALWYYYTGFPIKDSGGHEYTHSLELVPTVSYRLGPWTLESRTILHNILYASQAAAPERWGYALVLRQMLRIGYQVLPWLGLLLAEEPFLGLIPNLNAEASMAGFWPRGLRLNRVYAGVAITPIREVTLIPQYIYETAFGDGTAVVGHGQYLFLTLVGRLDLSPQS